jgi:hypothetical protein
MQCWILFFEANKNCWVDVKGVDTAVSRLKRKLVKAFHNIDVEVVRR